MSRLIHLNGPPGIGKSTIARRYVVDHPGVLNCDIDQLRHLIGGWEDDFLRSGALIRPAAIAMISAYLASGHDVVLPQMLVRLEELQKFEAATLEVSAEFVEVVLMDTPEASVARFHRRGAGEQDSWHEQVRQIVAGQGGDAALGSHTSRSSDSSPPGRGHEGSTARRVASRRPTRRHSWNTCGRRPC